MNHQTFNIEIDQSPIQEAMDTVFRSWIKELMSINELSVLLTRNQVCKLYKISTTSFELYRDNGLQVLPDGRVSMFHLNEYLGKYSPGFLTSGIQLNNNGTVSLKSYNAYISRMTKKVKNDGR